MPAGAGRPNPVIERCWGGHRGTTVHTTKMVTSAEAETKSSPQKHELARNLKRFPGMINMKPAHGDVKRGK